MPLYANPSIRSLARPVKKGVLGTWLLLLTLLVIGPKLSPPAATVVAPVEADPTTGRFSGTSGRYVGLYGGVLGRRSSTCEFGQPDYGASCQHTNGNIGILGHSAYGVFGQRTVIGPYGILGHDDYGVYGTDNEGNFGFLGGVGFGGFHFGVHGEHAEGNFGFLGGDKRSVFGLHTNGHYGTLGGEFDGAVGQHNNLNTGYLGAGDYGAYGFHFSGQNEGWLGGIDEGVFGMHFNDHYGSIGGSFYGVRGWNANDNRGYLGHNLYGVWGFGSPWAGYFDGDVRVLGTLTEGAAAFKVDHPLDPENQYLSHSAVESPDMMNVYNGNVVTDARGEAVVELPSYFEALNRDFRYQLTALGAPGPNLYVAEKIAGNRFKIAGGVPGLEVSWQVTGIRHDAWAEAHRIVVEEAKPAEERGYYLHPALYGQPEERSVAWVRDPEGMRAVEERPARLEAEHRRMEAERQRLAEEREQIQQQRERLGEIRGQQ